MRDLFFVELGKCNAYINEVDDEERLRRGGEIIVATIDTMINLNIIARRDGLLALEEAMAGISDLYHCELLDRMIGYVIAGVDPQWLEEVAYLTFFAEGYKEFEALQYLIMLMGVLDLQAGTHPVLFKARLLTMVPGSIQTRYQEMHKGESDEDADTFPAGIFDGDIQVTSGDDAYFILKVTDYALRNLETKYMQRLLKDVINADLAVSLIGLSGDARRCVLEALPQNLAISIAKDMEFMGKVKLKDIATSTAQILNTLINLSDSGEIECRDNEALDCFNRIFAKKQSDDRVINIEMTNILQEYLHDEKTILSAPWVN